MAKSEIQFQEVGAFPCTACGQCCKNVHLSEQTSYLDRGDGACQYFNDDSLLCNIYNERPLICRVEDYYNEFLSNEISWGDFVSINLSICKSL